MASPTTKKNQHGQPYNKEEPTMVSPTTKKNQHTNDNDVQDSPDVITL
jgi:hypothetical protein